MTYSISIFCSTFFLSLTLKNNIPWGRKIGSEISPISVLIILFLKDSLIVFSLIQPKFPPLIEDSAILSSIAVFSKPSFLILSFIFLISESTLLSGTELIIISEIKYSSIYFFS